MLKYVLIWVGLMVLTTATFLLSKVPTGHWAIPIAMAIAAAKGGLIVLFYMEMVKHRGGSAIAFGTSLIFVGLLMTFALFDVTQRFAPMLPPGPLARPIEPGSKELDPMKRYDTVPYPRGPELNRPVHTRP